MIDCELIQVVAKRLVWERLYFDKDTDSWWGIPPEGLPTRTGGFAVLAQELPPWLTSLDAAQAVVETLDEKQMIDWGARLFIIIKGERILYKDVLDHHIANASAKHRIEAYAKVWEKEGEG